MSTPASDRAVKATIAMASAFGVIVLDAEVCAAIIDSHFPNFDPDPTGAFIKQAKALVDSVSFDMNGGMVAGRLVGGHGGLISKETEVAADRLRRLILDYEARKAVEG